MKYYAIIVGGGSGSRMQSDIPKQFLLLNGKPLIMHTIEAFYNSRLHPEIILVLNIDFHKYWEDLCDRFNFETPHTIVKAGRQRFFSVKNGLKIVKGNSIVAIHDAVRPIVSDTFITSCFQEAEKTGSAIPAIVSRDSVRQRSGDSSFALNRDDILMVQTPQVFSNKILNKAYKQVFRIEFTDDASVVEKSGTPVHLVEGDSKNIKITYPEDLILAQAYLKG
ncbi:2-C-methyl-D-erythritol 4-phosphate cytidylyltransferase [Daejeonella oryzae]|uniref:2-C-methyl-D-erythritol 4-phosphate cytidylyltransferase n=1 Tax=Daejeonella oryzae TaxID=1122943 RepID=UPI000402E002|nr:2-C-methyl-D-erythritol 4-phosphate cytidylyltransferase [Daejeonella oryzae]